MNFTFGVPNAIVVTIDGEAGQTGALSGANSCNVDNVTYNAQIFTATSAGSAQGLPFFVLAN